MDAGCRRIMISDYRVVKVVIARSFCIFFVPLQIFSTAVAVLCWAIACRGVRLFVNFLTTF